MEVNIVSSKLIKPSTPTPQHLNNHTLSFIDELKPPMNVGILLFYPPSDRSRHLEESLAQILPQFYPLAGRYIKKNHSVDCRDQGAEFVQAQAVGSESLADLVAEREADRLNHLLPCGFHQVDESPTDPLLSIQVTGLRCGGVAIGISISHRILDASSVGTFIASWSNASTTPKCNSGDEKICPTFDSHSLFPPGKKNDGYAPNPEPSETRNLRPPCNNVVVKRFSFNKEAIATLRSRSTRTTSRVRVVCAVIARALISLDKAKQGGRPRDCLLVQAVNMRGRTIPPLPKHSCGNLVISSLARCISAGETESIGIQELVDIIGDGIERTVADCGRVFSPGGDGRGLIAGPVVDFVGKSGSGEVNVVMFSDWSKFGFYEADFGWGRPVGAGIGALPGENMAVLMDSKEGDGMEAWVHLDRDHVSLFEQHVEINYLIRCIE